jgi:hypothetical protein
VNVWRSTILSPGRQVEAASDGDRAVLWEGETVLVRGHVRAVVELVDPVLVDGTDADVEVLRRWLRGLFR